MKKIPKPGSILTLLTLMICLTSLSFAEDTLAVEDGFLLVQGYRIALSSADKPIVLRQTDTHLIITVESKDGIVDLMLADADIQLSDQASGYVNDYRTIPEPSPRITSNPRPNTCPTCGIEPADHYCPRCHKPYCNHDDIACGYRLNPVPTPQVFKDANGKTITHGATADGKYLIDTSANKAKAWEPGKEYLDKKATPSPNPSHPVPLPTP